MRRIGPGRRRSHRSGTFPLIAAAFLVCVATLTGSATATPVFAAAEEDGLWYFYDTGIAQLHEDGVTGEGVTVAVIDSPISLGAPDLANADVRPRTDQLCPGFSGVETTQRARHATAMVSILVGDGAGLGAEPGVLGVAPDATVLHYAVLDVAVNECAAPLADLVADAIDEGADILNLSIAYDSPRDAETAIELALDAGLIVNVAVQNQSSDHLDLLSGLPGVVSIENVDRDGQPDEYSVTGPGLDFVAPGVDIRMLNSDFSGYELDHGTSPATAWMSGAFALAKSAWPEASGNQLIQSAIRSATVSKDGQAVSPTAPVSSIPRTDESGFGQLDVGVLVATDPTGFPDVNPLLAGGAPPPSAAPTRAESDLVVAAEPSILWIGAAFVIATGLYVAVLTARRRGVQHLRS